MLSAQLRLTSPTKRVRTARLTERQNALLGALRWRGRAAPLRADDLGRMFGYKFPSAACDRLVARGLAVKVAPGVYRARVVGERRKS